MTLLIQGTLVHFRIKCEWGGLCPKIKQFSEVGDRGNGRISAGCVWFASLALKCFRYKCVWKRPAIAHTVRMELSEVNRLRGEGTLEALPSPQNLFYWPQMTWWGVEMAAKYDFGIKDLVGSCLYPLPS